MVFRSDYTPKIGIPRGEPAADVPESDQLARFRLFEPGEVLFEEGERGGEAYIIRSGRVRISHQTDGEKRDLGIREPDTIIGEMAIISDMPRMATATAEEETVCVVLSRSVFRRLVDSVDLETRATIVFLVDYIRQATESDPVDHELVGRNCRILETIVGNPETEARIERLEPFFTLLCSCLIERAREQSTKPEDD